MKSSLIRSILNSLILLGILEHPYFIMRESRGASNLRNINPGHIREPLMHNNELEKSSAYSAILTPIGYEIRHI